jgi:hypothetical protein
MFDKIAYLKGAIFNTVGHILAEYAEKPFMVAALPWYRHTAVTGGVSILCHFHEVVVVPVVCC